MTATKRAHSFIAEITQRVVLPLFVFLLLVACSKSYDEVKSERAKAVNKSATVNIAVIWNIMFKDLMLVEGITQAADEMNAKGGLYGRKIKITAFYSENDAEQLKLAQKVAKDTSFAAVIGHENSAIAIPASIMYEYHGLLFVSPSASNSNLTNHDFEYTFRTIPSDSYVSREIAVFMKSQGHQQVAILDDRSIYGKGIADGVMESLADIGLKTEVRRHYSPGKTDFKPLCAELAKYEFDALFIGAILPQAADFIREARQMGIKQRVYGGDSIDSRALERIAGKAANGTVVPTTFNAELDNPVTREFVKTFRKRYEKPPDRLAAVGYDSLKILIEAMKRGKSADPTVVAANMRFIKDWQGVTGSYTYNLDGDLEGKKVISKYLNQTRFIYFDAPEEAEHEFTDTD